jgi:DNA polymerase-3 subunit epsilon
MYAVIDFETTNRAENRRATEVAIAVLGQDFEVLETFESVINPQTAAYRESLGYSRLTQKELDAAPAFEQLWPQVSNLLSGNIMVMHNADFDRKVLENEFQAMGADSDLPPFVCTLKSAQRSIKGRPKTGGYTLSSLALDLGFAEEDAHQALSLIHI